MIIISTQAFPPDSGGKQTLMKGLAKAAAAHDSVMVLADRPRETGGIVDENAPYSRLQFGGPKFIRQRLKAAYIAKLVKENAVSRIFCDSWRSAEHLPKNLGPSVVIYAHGNEYPLDTSKVKRLKAVFEKVDHIIAVSSQTAQRVGNAVGGASTPKIHIVHNPVEPAAPISAEDETFAEQLWPSDGIRLLSLCRLIDWKGVDMAITAVAELRGKDVPAQLVIAGIGDDRPRLEARVNEHELTDHVHFAGRVEGGRKSALFESADIFMQPGRKIGDQCEGFGITYIEAGLHGLPSIAGDAGGAPDAVIDGKTGLVVDGTNQSVVTKALLRLIDEPALGHHMGQAAKAHGRTLLWDTQIKQILDLTADEKSGI
ncbi:glycosyltransferase family 4 protein [Fretibacter rubidus]|uniref:glycosyltransferase family 4 protein n=1 Tax=Fretibacter rubidus TaxID=570162 RepID=UPI00352A5512